MVVISNDRHGRGDSHDPWWIVHGPWSNDFSLATVHGPRSSRQSITESLRRRLYLGSVVCIVMMELDRNGGMITLRNSSSYDIGTTPMPNVTCHQVQFNQWALGHDTGQEQDRNKIHCSIV